jgi:tripartite-type tricarboxylate transporter receptor subunit TctC
VAKLNHAFAAALQRPELSKMLAQQGLEMASSADPENLRAFMARETARWHDVVKSSGAQLD